jgi:hypothetical protein
MAILSTPTFGLTPSSEQVPLSTNYITNFDFLNQYLPDTYEKEFERYGNRTVSSFLRMVGAEMPSNSDLIKWAEQGRLHTKYTNCVATAAAAATTSVFTITDATITTGNTIAIRLGQTVMITDNATGLSNKGIVIVAPAGAGPTYTITIAYYEHRWSNFCCCSSLFYLGIWFRI